jgi:hypothetical protein
MTVQITNTNPTNNGRIPQGIPGDPTAIQVQGDIDEKVLTLTALLQPTGGGQPIHPTLDPQQNVPTGSWIFTFTGVQPVQYSLAVSGMNSHGTGSSGITFTVTVRGPVPVAAAPPPGAADAGGGAREEEGD